MNLSFIEALKRDDLAALKAIPKTDLHHHLILGARIERVEAWTGLALPRPPEKMNGVDGMMRYAVPTVYPYLNSRDGFEFTADAALQDALEDGVSFLETSVDTRFALLYPDHERDLIAFLSSLLQQYQARLTVHFELGFARGDSSERLALAYKCVETGFFTGIDLYGDETLIAPYRDLAQTARQAGLCVKAHVGEYGKPELIRPTVEAYELDAIQHGISAVQSPDLLSWLARHQVPCHVCPSSNVMLGAVESLVDHPIKTLYEHEVRVTINTDDLMIFGQGVSEEYLNLYRVGVLDAEALNQIRETGFALVS